MEKTSPNAALPPYPHPSSSYPTTAYRNGYDHTVTSGTAISPPSTSTPPPGVLFHHLYAAQLKQPPVIPQADTLHQTPITTSISSASDVVSLEENQKLPITPDTQLPSGAPSFHASTVPTSQPQSYYYPPPPIPAVYFPPPKVEEENYYKGFHDGVVRPHGPVVGSAASWLGPFVVNMVLLFGPLIYFRRKYMKSQTAGKAGKGIMDFMSDMMSPVKARNFRTEVKGTTFNDVIGIPEAKEELKQYVDFLKNPDRFRRLGARLPKGCLLTGQPGTGKTLLARAVAGEASTPFFSCSGADFIEVFGGSGPKRVRELFEEARKAAPCVVFIDEIDALGSRNQGGPSMGGGGSEDNRTINQLLSELDGLSTKEPIVVVAATNYQDAIDKALLRDGRFDRKVNIPMPDKTARKELFEYYLGRVVTGDKACKPVFQEFKKTTEASTGEQTVKSSFTTKEVVPGLKILPEVRNDEYAARLADRTPGVSPAQIATIVNEAALEAAAQNCEVVPLNFLQDAIDDVLIGKKHRQRMSGRSLQRTAYHEVGHCIMAWLSPLQKDVVKISIIPRGRAGGYTQQIQDEALEPQTKEILFSQLCVLMGGRVAEKVFQEDISTGAMDDLQRATRLAMEVLLKCGMSSSIGQLAFKPNEKNDGRAWMTWSEELHTKVEAEARAMVSSAFRFAEETILKNKDKHVQLAELLLEKKELGREEIQSILGARPALVAESY